MIGHIDVASQTDLFISRRDNRTIFIIRTENVDVCTCSTEQEVTEVRLYRSLSGEIHLLLQLESHEPRENCDLVRDKNEIRFKKQDKIRKILIIQTLYTQ